MKITTNTASEFLECLLENKREFKIFEGTIRVSSDEVLIGDPKHSTKYEVVLTLSAVIETGDGDQYILICKQVAGLNYMDASNDTTGTKVLQEIIAEIKERCSKEGWQVLPGVISE